MFGLQKETLRGPGQATAGSHTRPALEDTSQRPASVRAAARWLYEAQVEQRGRAEAEQRLRPARAKVAQPSQNGDWMRQEAADKFAQDYPHGAPKAVLLRLHQDAVQGVPDVGFGQTSLAPCRQLRTLRMV